MIIIITMWLLRRKKNKFVLNEANILSQSIEWFIEDLALSRSYYLAPPRPPPQIVSLFLSIPVCRCMVEITDGRRWKRESLVLYKSFNTLSFVLCGAPAR